VNVLVDTDSFHCCWQTCHHGDHGDHDDGDDGGAR